MFNLNIFKIFRKLKKSKKDPPSLFVKKSKISGKGVFTSIPIKKGQTICFLTGKVLTIEEMIKTVDSGKEKGSDPLGIDDETYLDLDELFRNINHSCNPNSYIKGKNQLVALKDIKTGEEINFDYSTTMNDNEEKINQSGSILWTCKCRCGSKSCRGIINQFKTLPKKKQNFYLKNKFAPDFILRNFSR